MEQVGWTAARSTRRVMVSAGSRRVAPGDGVQQGDLVQAGAVFGVEVVLDVIRLVKRSHDFLVGVWPLTTATSPGRDADDFTQPLRPADEDRIRAFLLAYPGVTAIREILVTFTGPGRVWVTARLDIDDDLTGAQVKSLVRGIESGMKHESENVYRVDVVPIGGAPG